MTVSELAPAQVADWAAQVRASGLTPYVLDVREDWERDAAHVQPQAATQGFVLLTEPLSRLGASLDRLPEDPDTPIACLCHHGVR
ncbi:MAG: sulfurtransferase, partial [Brachymonas denitrificans]